jgi:hypothetical protein
VSWHAGREASQHAVYLSSDANAVANGLASSVTSNTSSLDLTSLDLQLDETYYWRVDEVNESEVSSVWAGDVWNFSTAAYLTIDDFESYNKFSPNRPFQTWLDGVGYSADQFFPVAFGGNGTGSRVGHDIWNPSGPYFGGHIMEITHTRMGSSQSMPFYYSNVGDTASQMDRIWPAPQDWSAHGIQTLVIYFHGTEGNTGQLYAKINHIMIPYEGNPLDLAELTWHAWHIDLGSLDVTNVDTLSLGVEGTGANGLILVDDIRLYRSAPE